MEAIAAKPRTVRVSRKKDVKTKTVSPEKSQVLAELKEAVDNLNKVLRGEMKARPLKEVLDEL